MNYNQYFIKGKLNIERQRFLSRQKLKYQKHFFVFYTNSSSL